MEKTNEKKETGNYKFVIQQVKQNLADKVETRNNV